MNYREDNPGAATAPMNDSYPRQKKGRGLLKFLIVVVVAAALFGSGLAVGRGDLQINGLSGQSKAKTTSSLDYSSVDQLYKLLQKDFDGSLKSDQLLDGLKTGLVNSAGDPYTEFFNPKEAKALNDELSGTFTGIGAELGTNNDNQIVIVSPLSGYPADQAGLRPKDVIGAIDGQSASGLSVNAAVRKIRGPVNTKVTLTIVRNDGPPFDVSLTRVQIKLPSVKSSIDGNIGYLKVSQFTNDTVDLARKAANDFKAKNVKGVVLDLRSNPGGYLSGAVDISSLWLQPGKTVVQERRGSTVIGTERAAGSNPLKGIPTIVLIDNGSASASEIVAGALRDNGAATLVGEKSFGKGSVQQVENLPDGSELKVTVARWYTPAGKNIDKQGITPEAVVTTSDDDKKAGRDPQKDRAYQLLRQKIGS